MRSENLWQSAGVDQGGKHFSDNWQIDYFFVSYRFFLPFLYKCFKKQLFDAIVEFHDFWTSIGEEILSFFLFWGTTCFTEGGKK